MGKIIVRLETTNSVNDEVRYTWKCFDEQDIEGKDQWKKDLQDNIDKWHKTPGARSIRWIHFNEYTSETFKQLDMSELEGVSVAQFLEFIK